MTTTTMQDQRITEILNDAAKQLSELGLTVFVSPELSVKNGPSISLHVGVNDTAARASLAATLLGTDLAQSNLPDEQERFLCKNMSLRYYDPN